MSNKKTNWLRIFNEILARYSENPIKHAIALCEENAYFSMLKHMTYIKKRIAQIPETISPGGLNFVQRRIVFVSPQSGNYFTSIF